jgi:Domain of unknown function (DUF4166)
MTFIITDIFMDSTSVLRERSPSLYRRVLGPRFDLLPEVLRRFHDASGGGRAHGTLRVERATGWLRNALATLLGFPAAGNEVPVHLQVEVKGDRERWVREFGGHKLVTVQWAWDGYLMERAGPTTFSCTLTADGSCMRYEFQRAWILGVPLPRWLSPSVVSWVEAGENRWRIVVRISAPILGELVSYEGWVEPEFE